MTCVTTGTRSRSLRRRGSLGGTEPRGILPSLLAGLALLATTGCGRPYLEWTAGETGVAEVDIVPEDIVRFGSVAVEGKTAFEDVRVTATGIVEVMLQRVEIGEGSDGFGIDYNPAPVRIAVGDSRTVSLSFSPTRTGSYTGIVQFEISGASSHVLTRELQGWGCEDPDQDGQCRGPHDTGPCWPEPGDREPGDREPGDRKVGAATGVPRPP